MTAHATAEELATYLGTDAPADADRLLERASTLIDSTVLAAYTVDDEAGTATDTDVAAALRDAVCAQVEQWLEVGEANDVDGLAGTAVTIGALQGRRAPRLAPRAFDHLQAAGLLQIGAQLP